MTSGDTVALDEGGNLAEVVLHCDPHVVLTARAADYGTGRLRILGKLNRSRIIIHSEAA